MIQQPLNARSLPRRIPASATDQFMNLVQILHDSNIRCVIQFTGQIDACRMARAVRLSLDSETVLGCRFVERKRRPYWERIDDIDGVQEYLAVKSPGGEEDLSEFMACPIDPVLTPPVQVGLFRSDNDILCIKLHHMATDAIGAMEYAYLLSGIYRKLKENIAYLPFSDVVKNRGAGEVLRHISTFQLLRGCCYFIYPRPTWSFPSTARDTSGIKFISRRIGEKEFDNLKEYCRLKQVSMNDVLLAAWCRAMFKISEPLENQFFPLEMTVNLRRHWPCGYGNSIRNLSSAFYPSIRYSKNDRFIHTLAKTRAAMEKGKKRQPWLGAMAYLEIAIGLFGFSFVRRLVQTRISKEMASAKIHPFFANVGVVDDRKLNFGDAVVSDVAMFGPVPYPPASIFSINSFQKTMVFTSAFCDASVDSKKVEDLFDRFLGELPIR